MNLFLKAIDLFLQNQENQVLFSTFFNHFNSVETFTETKEEGMDCSMELSLGLSIGTGRINTKDKDREYASVNGHPVQLDMFPLAPFLPPGEKTLRRISIFLPSLTLN